MIKEISTPKLKNPIFIAAWPGMGEVAYRCALFLREVMEFKMFAKLESKDFFKPSAILVDKGIIDLPSLPAGIFYYGKAKNSCDIILFLGEAQPPLEYAEKLSIAIINFVKKYKTKFIFTFAAKPEAIDHKADSSVWIAATDDEVLKNFNRFSVKVLESGQISGLNGIILGVAKRKNLKGVCLLGEIPFYTAQIENPKACANILKILSQYLGLNLNLLPLIERARFIEDEIDKLISYLRGEAETPFSGPTPLSEEDIEKIKKDLATYTKLPQSAREKIEELFKEAQKDITKAAILKTELDKWNVYKEYEDKFLDLFKKKQNPQDQTH
ncbi:MAG: PAC2 family protein [Candidatus Omnitrophica bacterium]|nr:PAC2 family protein [Candidatus Omnitrophota bacterium]MCM8832145.1 PAC2 family protein [Candidatus Omnitrophota bacterium]